MQKNVAGQKWVVFAFSDQGGASPGEPVTGDAANITANVYLDGGAANAVDDTNPTELGGGYYVFDITQAECNAENIVMVPASATANVNVIGVPGAVWTTPANYPDLSITATDGRVDVGAWLGTAVTTSATSAKPEVDAFSISDDSTAANNLELEYDGTGYRGDGIKKNAAFANFMFLMVDSTDHVTAKTGLTVTGQRSIDGAAFASVAGTIAEIANGIYQFDADAADTNGDVITWRFSGTAADDAFFTFKTTTT